MPASAQVVPEKHTTPLKDSSNEHQCCTKAQCFLALVSHIGYCPQSKLRVGLLFNPWPTNCLYYKHRGSAPKTIFRVSQLFWIPAYLAAFPKNAWAWSHQQSCSSMKPFNSHSQSVMIWLMEEIVLPHLTDKLTLEQDDRSWPAVIPQIPVSDLLSFYRKDSLFYHIVFFIHFLLSRDRDSLERQGKHNF